jgi:hypothetical protein
MFMVPTIDAYMPSVEFNVNIVLSVDVYRAIHRWIFCHPYVDVYVTMCTYVDVCAAVHTYRDVYCIDPILNLLTFLSDFVIVL